MKTIRVHEFGGPEVMRLEEMPEPVPGAGEIVLRARAIGINPVDTYIRAGAYTPLPSLPYTPGSDAAGIVHTVGEGVKSVKKGDRVYLYKREPGTYAELVVARATEAHPLPQNVSFGQGAGVGVPYATAFRALFGRAKAQTGETVLVHGASGGVGIASVQLARSRGLTVIGTAGTDQGMKLAADAGAHHVLDHSKPDYLNEIPALTGGHGVNIVIEMLANVNLDKDLGILALAGRVVIVGNRGRTEIDPRQTMGKDSAILGMRIFNVADEELAMIHGELVAGLADGTLNPVVGRELPLKDAPEAHVAVMRPRAHGKIVLIP